MEEWIGRYWIQIWSSKKKQIVIGFGDDLGDGYYGPFFIRNKRWWKFWLHIAKPTLEFINRGG